MKDWLKRQLDKKWGFRIIIGILITVPLLIVVWFMRGEIPNIFKIFSGLFKKNPVVRPSAKDSVTVKKNPTETDVLPETPDLDKTLEDIDADI